MKNVKKILAVVLALVLAMSTFATVASAVNITVNEDSGSFVGYKLLSATDLGNDKFSYTVNSKYSSILQTATETSSDADAIDAIAELEDNGTAIRALADTIYKAIVAAELEADATATSSVFADADAGYWLIADVTDNTGAYKANSLVMLDTAGNEDITVNVKKSLPTVEKKIVEDGVEKDVADFNIGDEVTFKLTGTVSDKIGSYDKYYYEFIDTMENLTYVAGSAAITIDGENYTDSFTVEWDKDTKKLTVTCADLLAIKDGSTPVVTADSTVVVTYNATLDADADIGGDGNENVVYLEYSNNPYKYQEGDDVYVTGETPEDAVVVFTYEIAPVKKDGSTGNALQDAEFVLYRVVGDATQYVVLENGVVKNWTTTKDDATVVVSGPDGLFSFTGLDAGEYFLEEINPPSGYNPLTEAIAVVITATYKADGSIDALTATVDGDDATATAATGIVTFDVENNSGSQLPSTGGIGTYIFYSIGAVLVIGAVVYFIVRKRTKIIAE